MNNTRAYTMAELQVSLVIAAILVLTIGAISTLSTTAHKKTLTAGTLYADLNYGSKLLLAQGRAASSLQVVTPNAVLWSGNLLNIGVGTINPQGAGFGLYKNGTVSLDVVYLKKGVNWNDPSAVNTQTNRDTILSVPVTGNTVSLSFSPCNPSCKSVDVTLNASGNVGIGTWSTTVSRRTF